MHTLNPPASIRRNLIKNLWLSRKIKTATFARVESIGQNEIARTLENFGTKIDDSNIEDEEIRGAAPSITEEEIESDSIATTSFLLDARERRQLSRDMLAARMTRALVPVGFWG